MNQTFTLFQEDMKAMFDVCDYEEAGKLIKALIDYNESGEEPSEDDMLLQKMFVLLRNQLDRINANKAKRSESGKLGGRGRKNESRSMTASTSAAQPESDASEQPEPRPDKSNEKQTKANESKKKQNKANESKKKQTKAPILSNPILSNPLPNGSDRAPAPARKLGFYKNVCVSESELAELRRDLPEATLNRLIEELSCYIKSSGKTYHDHAATLRGWYARDKEKPAASVTYVTSQYRSTPTMNNFTTGSLHSSIDDEAFKRAKERTFSNYVLQAQ